MTERFLKLNIESDAADDLAAKHPKAFILLYFIARHARRYNGKADGLTIGQCHIGNHKAYGLTEREYRTAKDILCKRSLIKIIETCRTRKKSTTGTTTWGTLVELLNSKVWDINPNSSDDRNDDRATTERRQTKKNKKEKKEDHPPTPSFSKSSRPGDGKGLIDDFFSKIEVCPGIFLSQQELDDCVKIKGSIEKVKEAIAFIQASKRRRHEILDWPNALAKWKIANKASLRIEESLAYAEKLFKAFPDFKHGGGWRCSAYYDKNLDQKGVLFESQSVYVNAVFVPFVDPEFKQKCETFVQKKMMIAK
jgi:hypothetical protein